MLLPLGLFLCLKHRCCSQDAIKRWNTGSSLSPSSSVCDGNWGVNSCGLAQVHLWLFEIFVQNSLFDQKKNKTRFAAKNWWPTIPAVCWEQASLPHTKKQSEKQQYHRQRVGHFKQRRFCQRAVSYFYWPELGRLRSIITQTPPKMFKPIIKSFCGVTPKRAATIRAQV